MNIALLIGVSQYVNLQNLPGCANDLEAISKLLSLTKKYDKITTIDKNDSSAKVKERIVKFFEEMKDQEIDEIFFYYTGHGEFSEDNFFYLLSDFDSKRKNSTTFQNDFIDNLIRTINPKLTIKLIDACQSGESYIKSNETVKAYFKSTAGKLSNCYFLSSSQNDQASWARKFSSFTQAFLEAIRDSQTEEIRYLNIIDYITDYFERNPEQTPFYITQGSFTEKFCHQNDDIKDYLTQLLNSNTPPGNGTKGSYIDIILEQGKKFLTEGDIERFMIDTSNWFHSYKFDDELHQIYDLEVVEIENKDDYSMDYKPIGVWLSKSTDSYFAKPKKKLKAIKTPEGKLMHTHIIIDYTNTVELRIDGIYFIFNAKFGNIASYDLTYMFVVSKKEIRLFKSLSPYAETGWNKRELDDNLKWRVAVITKEQLSDLNQFWQKEIGTVLSELKEILKEQFDAKSNPEVLSTPNLQLSEVAPDIQLKE